MGNLNVKHQCCISDSSFSKDIEDVKSNDEVEKEPFKLLDKTFERAESIIEDFSPSRKSSKSRNND